MKFTSCASFQVCYLSLWFPIFSETRDSFPFTQIEDEMICDPPSGHTPTEAHRSEVLGLAPSSSQFLKVAVFQHRGSRALQGAGREPKELICSSLLQRPLLLFTGH